MKDAEEVCTVSGTTAGFVEARDEMRDEREKNPGNHEIKTRGVPLEPAS